MKDLVVNSVRAIVQWTTLVLTVIFRDQFATGAIARGIGGIMIVLGITLWILSRIALGQVFTSSLMPKGFVTKGVYSKLRHPMYTGGLLLYVGIGILLQSIVGLMLMVLLILPLVAYSVIEEERQMLEEYGEEYADYRKGTIL